MRKQPAPQTVEAAPLQIRAEVRADTINVEARTADLVFSTGAPVLRYDWMTGSKYLETLSMKPGQIRLGRLNAGAPFLNAHSTYDVGDVLGVVVDGSARIEKGEARATVRFSRRADVEPVWQDVRDGILRNVSVGYRVHKYEQAEGGEDGKIPTRLAIDWEPYEISAVPIGADAGAQVRAEDKDRIATNPCVITHAAPTPPKETRMDPETQQTTQDDAERTATIPATEPTDADRAREAERARVQGIMRGARAGRLTQAFADKLIEDGVALVDAQTRILAEIAARGQEDVGPRNGPSGVRVGADPGEHVIRGITGAFLNRIDPETFKHDANSRAFRSRSLLRCAEMLLEQRGHRTQNWSKMEIAGAALGMQVRSGLHTTSDFPLILADVANKTLRAAYEASPQTFAPITRRVTIADFKSVSRNQLGEFPALEKVNEHGEFTSGTITEGKETYRLATYGKVFGVTRQAIVNDDLNAFGRIVTMAGQSARNLESDIVWYQILKNAAMGDTVALFHADHGNLAGSAAAIDIGPLGIGRAALRKQTGVDGRTYLNLSARYLIVPPGKETLADQYTTVITPALGSSVNPFAGRLTVISEPRLEGGVTVDGDTAAGSATAWYLAASLDQAIDIIELAGLDGENGPVIETQNGFRIDGVEWKCRHDVAAKVIDWRGLFKNAGA
jgi:hypothetical protein